MDKRLRERLDPAAADALEQWCATSGISFTLDRWLTNGRSSAVIAAVIEHHRFRGAELVIMKVYQATGDSRPGEFALHEDALNHDKVFADAHLAELIRAPVSGDNGWWFIFQRVAGGSLSDMVTLQTVLHDVLHPPRRPLGGLPIPVNGQSPQFPRAQQTATATAFAAASATVVDSTLTDWVGRPQLRDLTVPAILRRQLDHRAGPQGAVTRLAQDYTGTTLTCADEDQPLVNPFGLVFDTDRYDPIVLPTFIGRVHGDLHIENILVPMSLQDVGTSYQLIDLARYSAHAVLTRNPTHLVLHLLARTLNELGPVGRTAAIEMLLDPRNTGELLPSWLAMFIRATRKAAEDWARKVSLVDYWRDQVPLSLLACALTCMVRPSTRPQDRDWFLRLAANAATAILGRHPLPASPTSYQSAVSRPAAPSGDVTTPPSPTPTTDPPAPATGAPHPAATTTSPPSPPSSPADTPAGRLASRPASDVDIVISYAPTDQTWAAWIHYHLRKAGWRVAVADSTRTNGRRARHADAAPTRTLVVVSRAHSLDQEGTAYNPAGRTNKLVAVQVEATEPAASTIGVDIIDLVDLGEDEARITLLARISAILPR
ncbi:toll/interleukin-1 receptor domain-containing protein [Frankia sp. Ag45/Mut15]|uniref:Toll/interleukin-1 receptor domain-containing protein n=1 Tax=Frankia umida TaxID=573489 RepID=A0ABT0JWS8_9ACTN|nr:toll/interleukin-1 receptor domain-containing protein [Frankia umida]MCK9875946.1 toll/interleukin-1 receptor domain-containing protein [Frankia umida]